MARTFADRIIAFNRSLDYPDGLPAGFRVVNPFRENPETVQAMERFYRKYYDDAQPRRFIVGINPGRHGAGVTGIPFTDTKRLESVCGIRMESERSHEVSSVFIYDMIAAYGGAEIFYRNFYINSPFPLAIVRETADGKRLNANYYDTSDLFRATENFMIASLREQVGFGLDTSEVFVLGRKNADCIDRMNRKAGLFGRLTVLEHPRYIEQYKSKEKREYIDKYIRALGGPEQI
ncbi:SMUG2 DNA glycosylase family protein [Rikenella microfusus]|uniref:Uracil-DNA glycosylase-like domain-containing protein n=1 Tax=Rikenella microfusus TaxID=28139 RepID=A0A379MW77_9BACT|nr:SMUG2 DNA glycosylase family protein [Rikenella microfusus]SUE34892.1 Uncharacterised protein [Rikenella microfusus]